MSLRKRMMRYAKTYPKKCKKPDCYWYILHGEGMLGGCCDCCIQNPESFEIHSDDWVILSDNFEEDPNIIIIEENKEEKP